MERDLEEALDLIDKFPSATKEAIMAARGDSELADVLGTLNSVEQRVAEQRRLASVELPVGAEGERWRDERSGKNDYTFNLPQIMTAMQAAGVTLLDLVEAGVFDLKLKITRLEGIASLHGIDLTYSKTPVSMMGKEDAMVGKVWEDAKYPSWKPR